VLAPGQLIDRYELVGTIGEGGMAQVWAARDRAAGDRLIALKIIHSRFADNQAFRAMFMDEARIVSAITHPNVARVHDLGASGKLLYLAMEYVDGESLFALIAPQKRVPPAVALRIIADACAGLDVVHRAVDPGGRPLHAVHRDVSPQNLLVGFDGQVKIIDFGIAQARDRAAQTTGLGEVKGKLRYMAPEQARREILGPHTDVFGAGAVLFRMLAGRAPYAATNDIETMQALLAGGPPKATLPPDVPLGIARVVQAAIAPKVAERYATARDLKFALEEQLAELPPADVAGWALANVSEDGRLRRAGTFGRPPNAPPAAAHAPTARPPGRVEPLPAAPELAAPGWSPAKGTAPLAAPIAPRSDERARSFMDIGALGARAASEGPPPRPPLAGPGGSGGGATVDPDRPVDDPRFNAAAAQAVIAARPGVGESARKTFRLAIGAVLAVFALVVLFAFVPRIVRDRAIAMAHDAGYLMTIEHVSVGLGGISLRGVKLTAIAAPGVSAEVGELFADGIRARSIRITGLDAKIVGSYGDVWIPLGMLLEENRARFAGTPTGPRHLSVVNAHLSWDGVLGDGSHAEVSDVGLEGDSHGSGLEELKGGTGTILVSTGALHLGPWASTFETAPASSRIRVAFDPPIADGPSALFVWGAAAPLETTVRIARSPFKNLGVRPEELGLPADAATDLEVRLDGKLPATDRSEIKGTIALGGARAKDLPRRVDVRIDLSLGGTRGQPLDLDKTTVAIGPIVAAVTGTVDVRDLSVRVDAMFRSVPLTCDRLAKLGTKAFFGSDLASALPPLPQAFRVTGAVGVSGVVKYDSADPTASSVSWLARETCGVSIFGM
jgi:serine/threonine-protein kinase